MMNDDRLFEIFRRLLEERRQQGNSFPVSLPAFSLDPHFAFDPANAALTPHLHHLAGTRFYLLLPESEPQALDREQEEQILENIKKIIEYMYGSVGLPESRAKRDAVDAPVPTPEEAGLDIKRLEYVKYLIEHGILSEE